VNNGNVINNNNAIVKQPDPKANVFLSQLKEKMQQISL
jgi:hypothetical protein